MNVIYLSMLKGGFSTVSVTQEVAEQSLAPDLLYFDKSNNHKPCLHSTFHTINAAKSFTLQQGRQIEASIREEAGKKRR